MAAFFNDISCQYSALDVNKLPDCFGVPVSLHLTVQEVEEKMKQSKKKPSALPGDINCRLYDQYPEMLAVPVTNIFNSIICSGVWPELWKREYVTIIPKIPSPQEASECRNISCTNFLSKLFESFVLGWAREEVIPKTNQYGGEPKASATQLLVETIDYVTSSLEDNRAGVVLSAVDFSKAFNRLDHEHCLRAIIERGASAQVVKLLAAFLSGRTMTVRVGQTMSRPRQVNAGAPQGSVLGCYLFNMGVDNLEDNFVQTDLPLVNSDTETLNRRDDFPAVSTPRRVGRSIQSIPCSPIQPDPASSPVEFLPRVANIPPWILKPKDPTFKEKPIETRKFVDDGVNMNKVNMRGARLLEENGRYFKGVTDLKTEGLLNHIALRAEQKGMCINKSKTGLMCISAATSFYTKIQVNVQGEIVTGTDSMKILGLQIDSDCTFKKHVAVLRNRLRSKTWTLSKLRRRGLDSDKLVHVYKTLIRPSVEYLTPVWSPMISAEQSKTLERQQIQALKNIFGSTLSANKLRQAAGIERLAERRKKLCLSFASKCLTNRRTAHWFQERPRPMYSRRMNINYPKFVEPIVRTDRHRNSPKNYMRRLLNEAN